MVKAGDTWVMPASSHALAQAVTEPHMLSKERLICLHGGSVDFAARRKASVRLISQSIGLVCSPRGMGLVARAGLLLVTECSLISTPFLVAKWVVGFFNVEALLDCTTS